MGGGSGLGKSHSRAFRNIVSEAHTGPGTIPVPSGQSGKSHNSGGIRQSTKKGLFPSITENKVKPRLKQDLD